MEWEYTTLEFRILRKKAAVVKGVGYAAPNLPEDTKAEFRKLGEQGWELVSIIPVEPTMWLGCSPGTQGAVAFFKRKKEST